MSLLDDAKNPRGPWLSFRPEYRAILGDLPKAVAGCAAMVLEVYVRCGDWTEPGCGEAELLEFIYASFEESTLLAALQALKASGFLLSGTAAWPVYRANIELVTQKFKELGEDQAAGGVR